MSKNLYYKIQTLPQTAELKTESREFSIFRNKNRDLKTGELLSEKDTLELYYKSAGKNPLVGAIYSLSVGFVDEESQVIRVKVFKGSERSILQSFINTCNDEFFKGFKLTSFNFSFILPFLRSRMLINGMKLELPDGLIDIGRKPWTISGLDVQDQYKGVGWYQNSLEELAYICGLDTDFIKGEDVYSVFLEGGEKQLEQSIINETIALINCHRIIIGEEKCEEYTSKVELVGEVEEKKLGLMDRIFAKGELTKDLEKELLDKIKDYSKEEKQEVVEILKGTLGTRKVNAALIKRIIK